MDPQMIVAVILGIVQIATTVVLFLVSKLLSDNKEAINELRRWIKDVHTDNDQAIRDLTTVIEGVRSKLGEMSEAVARMEVFAEVLREERSRAR